MVSRLHGRVILLLLASLLAAPAQAVVDLANGNFFSSAVDLDHQKAGHEWRKAFERAYNSRTLHDGLFGFGWCSDLETKLEFRHDGSVVLRVCGTGEEVVFEPEGFARREREEQLAGQIMAALDRHARQAGNKAALPLAIDPSERQALRAALLENTGLREKLAKQLEFTSPSAVPVYRRQDEALVLVPEGFKTTTRVCGKKATYEFDRAGRLQRLTGEDGLTVALEYEQGKLSRVVYGDVRWVRVSLDENGKIARLLSNEGEEARFEHEQRGGYSVLTRVTNSWGNAYAYAYDSYLNLIEARWPDDTGLTLFYQNDTDWTLAFGGRDRCSEYYAYWDDAATGDAPYVARMAKQCGGELLVRTEGRFGTSQGRSAENPVEQESLIPPELNRTELETTRAAFGQAFRSRDSAAALAALLTWRKVAGQNGQAALDEWAAMAYQLGVQSYQMQQWETAVAALSGLMEVANLSTDAHVQDVAASFAPAYLAAGLEKLRRWDEVLAAWRHVKSNAHSELLRGQAEAYARFGRLAEAAAIRKRLTQYNDGWVIGLLDTVNEQLARNYAAVGNLAQAERYYRRAYLAHSLMQDGEALGMLRELADLLRRQGRHAEADELFGRAVEVARQQFGAQSEQVVRLLQEEATFLILAADYEGGLKTLAELDRAVDGVNLSPRLAAWVHNTRELAHSRLGRPEEALKEARLALASWREQDADLAVGEGNRTFLNNLAVTEFEAGNLAEAIRLERQVVDYIEGVLPPVHHDRGLYLGNLARMLLAAGEYAEGGAKVAEALRILEAWPGTQPWRIIRLLDEQAQALLKQGELAAAEAISRKALLLVERAGDDFVRWKVYALRGRVLHAGGDLAAATFWAKQAVAAVEEIRSRIAAIEPALFQDFVSDKSAVYRLLADALIGQGRLEEAEEAIALLKRDEQLTRRAGRNKAGARNSRDEAAWQESYRAAAEKLRQVGAEVAQLESLRNQAGLDAAGEQRLQQLYWARDDADRHWQKVVSHIETMARLSGQQNRSEPAAPPLPDAGKAGGLQKALARFGAGTVSLQYVMLPDKTWLLVTTPTKRFARPIEVPARELAAGIFRWRGELQQHGSDSHLKTAKKLYDWLISPVADDLAQLGAKTLMLSLDGKLRYLPFAALHDGQHYLGERYNLALFIPGQLVPAAGPGAARARLVAFGVAEPPRQLAHEFKALPFVRKELENIRQALPRQSRDAYLDRDFTHQRLNDALRRDYRVLHIASHFELVRGDPLNSRLLLGDGTLNLPEFERLPLKGLAWATFSACETALGGVGSNGSEVDSLADAAHKSGVATVLATLWALSDAGAPDFMASLYRRFAPGAPAVSKAAALREVQAEYRSGRYGERFRHPSFWAPYVLIGDWR